jgi:hypothetical protein
MLRIFIILVPAKVYMAAAVASHFRHLYFFMASAGSLLRQHTYFSQQENSKLIFPKALS